MSPVLIMHTVRYLTVDELRGALEGNVSDEEIGRVLAECDKVWEGKRVKEEEEEEEERER